MKRVYTEFRNNVKTILGPLKNIWKYLSLFTDALDCFLPSPVQTEHDNDEDDEDDWQDRNYYDD